MSVESLSTRTDPTSRSLERPEIQDPLKNRIKRAIARAFLVLVYIILFPVTIAAGICRFCSYLSTKGLIDELAEKRYQAVVKATQGVSLPNQCDIEGLAEATLEIQRFIQEAPPKGEMHDHLQELRELIDQVLQLPFYAANKQRRTPHLDYLHLLAHTLTAQAEGMDVLEKYGQKAIGGDVDQPSYEKLATVLDKAVKNHAIFKKDNKLHKAFWMLAHPEKGFNSLFDNLGWTDPLSYNSYRQGNANTRIGAFRSEDVKMHLSLGPTPTADRLFEAHLQYLKNQGQIHLQQDLEFAGAPGERDRRLEKKRMADRNSDTMFYLSTPLDGLIWKGLGPFAKIGSTVEFFIELKKYLVGYRDMPEDPKKDNSFYIPEALVEDKELDSLLQTTEQMFAHVTSKLDRRRLNRAQLLAFEAMVAVQAILRSTEGKAGDAYMGQACKQDIDRGVILNVMTMLYADALAGVPLTKERINQIVGIVLARPEMVDDRAILNNRYSALSDLLHLIGQDPEKFFAPMKHHFGVHSLSFATTS